MQIYKITNLTNNKIYIGKDTTSDPNYFGSGLIINRAFEKYGRENFIKEIIDETDNYESLSEKEIYWISFYNSTDRKIGYNISKGGDGGDTLSNHPDLDIIREKISKNSPKKGKTYEEAFGMEKAKSYKKNLSKSNKRHNLGKTYEELYGLEKTTELKKFISINTKNNWSDERKKKQSELSRNNISNSLLSEGSKIKNKKYLDERWNDWRDKEKLFLNSILSQTNIPEMINYLNKIPNSLFDNRKEFYEFVGQENKNLIKTELLKTKKFAKNKNKKGIIIDNIEYDSILESTKKLNIDRSLIRSRLKSPHFKNYLFQDDELNQKYRKFEDIDLHLSKKEAVSIEGKEYESITEAAKSLNKRNDYITWRLNSKSYPQWFYLNKEIELKETGDPKNKKVSVLGTEYESISKAVEETGIDRQLIRYRLRTNNYSDYFYI